MFLKTEFYCKMLQMFRVKELLTLTFTYSILYVPNIPPKNLHNTFISPWWLNESNHQAINFFCNEEKVI